MRKITPQKDHGSETPRGNIVISPLFVPQKGREAENKNRASMKLFITVDPVRAYIQATSTSPAAKALHCSHEYCKPLDEAGPSQCWVSYGVPPIYHWRLHKGKAYGRPG